MIVFYIIAFLCGMAVAVAEAVSRYKDEPFKAIWCWWGGAYLVFNGLLSLAGFEVLVLAGAVSDTPAKIDLLKNALLGGFGATTIMRTKLFNLKLEEGEKVSVGPDFFIDTFLSVLDRQIDRGRAFQRAEIVKSTMRGLDFEKIRIPLIMQITSSMQGISAPEAKELGEKVATLVETEELLSQDKSYALGFLALSVAGDRFFKNIFEKIFDREDKDKYKL